MFTEPIIDPVDNMARRAYSTLLEYDGASELKKAHMVAVRLESEFIKPFRQELVTLAIDALTTDGAHHKQWYLNEILSKLITSNDEWEGLKETYGWDEGRIP